jgi:hypothetical protein
MKRKMVVAMLLATTVLCAVGFDAQTTKKKSGATITGVVIGPDDKPAPRASVMCQSSGGIGPHAVYADSKGRFTITGLKQDSYDVRASSKGIFSEWEKNVPLWKGQTKELTLHLIYAKEMPKVSTSAKQKQK